MLLTAASETGKSPIVCARTDIYVDVPLGSEEPPEQKVFVSFLRSRLDPFVEASGIVSGMEWLWGATLKPLGQTLWVGALFHQVPSRVVGFCNMPRP